MVFKDAPEYSKVSNVYELYGKGWIYEAEVRVAADCLAERGG